MANTRANYLTTRRALRTIFTACRKVLGVGPERAVHLG
jgi:hypothetical protein